jgi:predicted metal-dependent phosphoesterase TrpH
MTAGGYKLLKADLHIHSKYSMDCRTSLEKIIQRCQQRGINCIAVADHGVIEGSLRMKDIAPFQVIVSEEILTIRGEIIGMFLKELVPSGLSLEESIQRIKEQGGLVCVPHPFDNLRGSNLGAETLNEIIKQIDVVEVFNARSPLHRYSEQALSFAEENHLPGSAGSDAHTITEIGNAYVEMPEFKGEDDFLQALVRGKVHGHRTSPLSRLGSTWARLRKK